MLIRFTINQVKQLICLITEYFLYNIGFAFPRLIRLAKNPERSVQTSELTNGINDQHTIVAAIVDGKGFIRHRLDIPAKVSHRSGKVSHLFRSGATA